MALIASSTEWTSGTTFLPSTLMTSCDTGGASSRQPPDPHENQFLECRCCEANLATSLVSSFGARKATCRTARPSVSLIFSSAKCRVQKWQPNRNRQTVSQVRHFSIMHHWFPNQYPVELVALALQHHCLHNLSSAAPAKRAFFLSSTPAASKRNTLSEKKQSLTRN